MPALTWLVKYEPRKQLAKDILAGVAVSFLIVPQGLSYAGVAGLPAIHGLCACPLRARGESAGKARLCVRCETCSDEYVRVRVVC